MSALEPHQPAPSSPLTGQLHARSVNGNAQLHLAEVMLDIAEVTARRGRTTEVATLLRDETLAIAPDTWLVRAALAAPGSFVSRLRNDLGDSASIVDQSSGLVTLRLSGAPVRAALAKLCRLDLQATAFTARKAARTIMAQIPVIVYRPDDTAMFDLMVPTTLVRAFAAHLVEAASEFGLELEPTLTRLQSASTGTGSGTR